MLPDALVQQAVQRAGLLLVQDLPGGRRSARRAGLVEVQQGVLAAATQPLGVTAHLEAVALAVRAPYAFLGATALWLHGVGPEPAVVEVGVPSSRGLSARPPVVGRRVAPALLARSTVRDGRPVVSLETAVVQAAQGRPLHEVTGLVEELLRARRTTPARLRQACRRGLAGSAMVGRALMELTDGDLEQHQRVLRRALEAAGIRDLESEVHLVSRSGASCWLDLLHRPSRRAFEIDGWMTHGTRDQQLVDRRRDRWVFREHGISTTRVAAREVRDALAPLVAELVPLLRV